MTARLRLRYAGGVKLTNIGTLKMAELVFEEVKVFSSNQLVVTFLLKGHHMSVANIGYGEGTPITVYVDRQPLDEAVAAAKLAVGKLGAELAEKFNHP